VEPKKEAGINSVIVGAVCIIMGAAAGISLHDIISRLTGWQALGYVLVAGVFIALVAVIVNQILSSLYDE
jgi:hypothetical protein